MRSPLNYHHLRYFWEAAREAGITRAAQKLGVSQPTLSAQIRRLERDLGEKLFLRVGRTLVLTEMGRIAFDYANAIFSLGHEFLDAVKSGAAPARPLRLVVGIADVLPKQIVRLLLEPTYHLGLPVRITCHEDKSVEEFIADLAVHTVDLVLADGPAPRSVRVKVFDHRLGESSTTVFGTAALARSRKRRFPQSLDGAPFVLPGARSSLHRSLNQWLDARTIRPVVIAEADDSALVGALGQDGKGFFVGPSVIEKETCRQHRVQVVGRIPDVRQQFYAISVERRLHHPAVLAICETARKDLFA
jgi:LysR family transcriptional regulator, transcriptional activator of nhaA